MKKILNLSIIIKTHQIYYNYSFVFFIPTFACGIFGTAPVRDLGGAVDPDIGCETHSVVVGTTEAYCNMCFGIRRRWRGPWPAARQCTVMENQRKPCIFINFWWFPLVFIDFQAFSLISIDFEWFLIIFASYWGRVGRPARPSGAARCPNGCPSMPYWSLLPPNASCNHSPRAQRLVSRRQALWQKYHMFCYEKVGLKKNKTI